jgi:tetratricopeptide (TPR) repeat protein
MGTVHKAVDRHLGRVVAIKLIRGVDPNRVVRLLREARAQARIDHPNICRVYEVGEIADRAYIAIQFVDGPSLRAAMTRMSLDEKVTVMRDIALAIQEAHRLGVIHRDLKPGNVMVERRDSGQWFPVVTDFGLARESTVEVGITESGAVLGTPAYMSPEQARGDVHAVDRRSDIYSLGATLYELLAGRPVFSSTSLAEMLTQVIHDDPPAPRSLVPGLPVDLETIALRCLAKDPAQRYPSARALADDLGRYLDGEPIVGRRPSPWQRLRQRTRRQRGLIVLGAWSLAIILIVAALGMRAWLMSRAERARSQDRAALASRLGEDATDFEYSLRTSYLLPLHDTRPERERVRAGMRAIAATDHDLGQLGDAIIHEALGRGHLALQDWSEAAAELAKALAAGRDTPDLHAAHGRALGELYHRELEAARRSGDRAWLDRRRREIDQQYLTPVLAELDAGRASHDGAALVEALVALYRRDYLAAERAAQAAAEHNPSLFEARKVAADAAYGAGMAAFDRGDYDTGRTLLERAASLYAEVSDIARSDASAYEAAAQTWLQCAEIDSRQGRSPREALDRALDVVDRALRAEPDRAPAYTTKSYVLLRWYRKPALRGDGDQRPFLERIAAAAQHAVEIDPLDPHAWDALGNAHIYRGTYEAEHGGHGAAWWNRAVEDIGKALALEPNDPWANNDAGVAHRWLGASLAEAGSDPTLEYQAALHSYERALALDPQYLYACSNQADVDVLIADDDQISGRDPQPAVENASRTGERCLEIDPNYFAVLDTMAQAQLLLARQLTETAGDPMPALDRARGHLDRADALHPAHTATWFYRLVAAVVEARFRLREGSDPTTAIAAAHAALATALRLKPEWSDCYVEAARVDLVEAAWVIQQGRGAAPQLASAIDHAEKAVALDSEFADAAFVAADAYLQLAKVHRTRAVAERGIRHADRALAINPRLRDATVVRAELTQLR